MVVTRNQTSTSRDRRATRSQKVELCGQQPVPAQPLRRSSRLVNIRPAPAPAQAPALPAVHPTAHTNAVPNPTGTIEVPEKYRRPASKFKYIARIRGVDVSVMQMREATPAERAGLTFKGTKPPLYCDLCERMCIDTDHRSQQRHEETYSHMAHVAEAQNIKMGTLYVYTICPIPGCGVKISGITRKDSMKRHLESEVHPNLTDAEVQELLVDFPYLPEDEEDDDELEEARPSSAPEASGSSSAGGSTSSVAPPSPYAAAEHDFPLAREGAPLSPLSAMSPLTSVSSASPSPIIPHAPSYGMLPQESWSHHAPLPSVTDLPLAAGTVDYWSQPAMSTASTSSASSWSSSEPSFGTPPRYGSSSQGSSSSSSPSPAPLLDFATVFPGFPTPEQSYGMDLLAHWDPMEIPEEPDFADPEFMKKVEERMERDVLFFYAAACEGVVPRH